MKLRNVCLMLVFLSLVLPIDAQNSSALRSTQADKSILLVDTTVEVDGPSGQVDAPTTLKAVGGKGGDVGRTRAGSGGGNILSSGDGGKASCQFGCQYGGGGASINVTGGSGGAATQNGGFGGNGGSITLAPGAGGLGSTKDGRPGNVIVNLPSGGGVGVGTTTPEATLDVVGGGTTLADAWTTRSSRRFKTNIQPLEGALEKVERLQGVSYQRKSDGKREIGVVAEDVVQVVPEVVSRDPKTQEIQGVDYSRLAVLLIEAVKSQQAEIQQLKAQIKRLTPNAGGQ